MNIVSETKYMIVNFIFLIIFFRKICAKKGAQIVESKLYRAFVC